MMYDEESLKEKFDKAFYNLLNAGKRLDEVAEQVKYAGKLIELNKAKQNRVKELLGVTNDK